MRNDYDQIDVRRMIERIVSAVRAEFGPGDALNLVGVRTRGEVVADRVAGELRSAGYDKLGTGVLDITLYRDDLSEIGPRPLVRPTKIDLALDGVPLVLVDDVLFTGRSIRAAMDALADLGRPSVIRLAVLVDRGGRELPIRGDYVGLSLNDVPPTHRIFVHLTETDGVDEVLVAPRN